MSTARKKEVTHSTVFVIPLQNGTTMRKKNSLWPHAVEIILKIQSWRLKPHLSSMWQLLYLFPSALPQLLGRRHQSRGKLCQTLAADSLERLDGTLHTSMFMFLVGTGTGMNKITRKEIYFEGFLKIFKVIMLKCYKQITIYYFQ